MKITPRSERGVQILDLSGVLTEGSGLPRAVDRALTQGAKRIVLNLRGTRSMDSSGLGELTRALQRARAGGGALKLLHVEDKVLELLQGSGVAAGFEIFEDESAALASFR